MFLRIELYVITFFCIIYNGKNLAFAFYFVKRDMICLNHMIITDYNHTCTIVSKQENFFFTRKKFVTV